MSSRRARAASSSLKYFASFDRSIVAVAMVCRVLI
jgi:hypothetical protein